MEGGVAFFLLLIIGIVVVVGGLALYLTGGSLLGSGDLKKKDVEDQDRPTHKRPTTPVQDNVELVGTQRDDERG
jgi:hypothetical protein